MKKIKSILLVCMILVMFSSLNAQEEVMDPNLLYKTLTNKYNKSEQDIQHPKKSISSSTWIKRGDLMIDIYNVDQEFLGIGMGKEKVTLFYKTPKEEKTEEIDGKPTTIMVYDRVDVYLQQGKVTDWKIKEMVTDKPLIKAYEAYKKALELDETGKVGEKINESLTNLTKACEKEAGLAFQDDDYKKSLKYFEYAVKTAELKVGENAEIDTSSIYNAGLAASNAKLYKVSAEYFNRAKDLGYGGANVYVLLKNAYEQMGDSSKVLSVLKEGFNKFPENNDLIVELINYYLNRGQSNDALEYLNLAKKADPTNATYYFAEGTLYDKMKEWDKTKEAYKKAIELKPDWFDPYYNMGVIYYNAAVEIYDAASKIPPNKEAEYQAEMKRGNDELEKAVPYMEKAMELAEKDYMQKPNDPAAIKTYKATMDTMKTIYFRLRNRNEEYQKKLDEVQIKLDSMQ